MFDTRKYLKMHFTSRMFIMSLLVVTVSVALFMPVTLGCTVEVFSIIAFLIVGWPEIKVIYSTIAKMLNRIKKGVK
jgi:hypothetical protein